MYEWWDKLIKTLAAIGGCIAGIFGGFDTMMIVLMAFMVIDYVTGLVVAWMGHSTKTENGHLDSKVGFVGLLKKVLMLMCVLVGALLDRAMGTDAAIFRSMIIWFYIANEGISIMENLALAGVPFPKRILHALEQLKDKNDEPPDEALEE